MTRVVGADVWRKGWVAVLAVDGALVSVETYEAMEALASEHRDANVIAVDTPIGLPANPPRSADVAARRFVGPRASSVFPTPPRDVLEAASYEDARRVSIERHGRGVSAQSYALRHRILETDAVARVDERIIEVHPEVSFRALAGEPLRFAKKTWNGQQERRQLLAGAGLVISDRLDGLVGEVPPDDVLDAAVAVWSGLRFAVGDAQALPVEPLSGQYGNVIWY